VIGACGADILAPSKLPLLFLT